MDRADFDQLVSKAYASLPAKFRKACEGVVVRSEDFANDDVLSSLGIESPYDLLGLYHGISLAHKSVYDLPVMPDMVLIYRMPILAYAEQRGLELEDVVYHVVVHELGHHMGFSDEDMEAIEFERDGPVRADLEKRGLTKL